MFYDNKNENQEVNIDVQRKSSVFWFACVDIKVLTDKMLTPIDKAVYGVLCVHVNFQTRKCNLKIKTIAEEVNCSARSVQYSLKVLEERGIIKRHMRFVEGSQISSGYELVGFEAECYRNSSEDLHEDLPKNSPEKDSNFLGGRTSCTRGVQETTPHNNDKSINDIIYPIGEVVTSIPEEYENNVENQESENRSESNAEKREPEYTISDVPGIMQETAEVLLLKINKHIFSFKNS